MILATCRAVVVGLMDSSAAMALLLRRGYQRGDLVFTAGQ